MDKRGRSKFGQMKWLTISADVGLLDHGYTVTSFPQAPKNSSVCSTKKREANASIPRGRRVHKVTIF